MKKFLESFLNIWKIEELKNRIFITLGLLLVYRFGAHVTLPGIDATKLGQLSNQTNEGIGWLINVFTGGAFSKASVFALGIMPYISASIVVQLKNNDLILGAVGILQFDVTAFRLKGEYNVECVYDVAPISTVRWVSSDNPTKLEDFKKKVFENLAEDGGGYLVYLANSRVNLQLTEERWPDIRFNATREL